MCSGTVLFLLLYKDIWRHSDHRAHEQYWKFREMMKDMDIAEESIREVTKQIKSTSDLETINKRLMKCNISRH